MSGFREIRGVQQRSPQELRRWFQSPFFDLFLAQDAAGDVRWFQLCYARDTWRERVLEWRRGRGFQHLRVRGGANPVKKDEGTLVADGVLPYREIAGMLVASSGLPPDLEAFLGDKIAEYARPPRKFRSPRARTPDWLRRLRFLDSLQFDR